MDFPPPCETMCYFLLFKGKILYFGLKYIESYILIRIIIKFQIISIKNIVTCYS